MTKDNNESFPCGECQAGVMHLRHITYFTWLNEELITAPNFPAWICDMCGRREYDARAVSWLVTLLNPETGNDTLPKHRTRPLIKKSSTSRPSPD